MAAAATELNSPHLKKRKLWPEYIIIKADNIGLFDNDFYLLADK